MAPDRAGEERGLTHLQRHLSRKLSSRRRIVHYMVREERVRYEEVARRLGLTRLTVSTHVKHAQRSIRDELEVFGIKPAHTHTRHRSRRARRRLPESRVTPFRPPRRDDSAVQ